MSFQQLRGINQRRLNLHTWFSLNTKHLLTYQNSISIYYPFYLMYTKDWWNLSELYPWTTATIETTRSSCRPFEAIMISFTQQSLPLICFCRVCVVSSSTRNWLTGQIHSKHHPLNSTCGGVAGQGLASPSACLRGGSIRSLNPSFSRGSLVMSWLEKKNAKDNEEIIQLWRKMKILVLKLNDGHQIQGVWQVSAVFWMRSLTGPCGIPGTLWTAVGTWSCRSCCLSGTS